MSAIRILQKAVEAATPFCQLGWDELMCFITYLGSGVSSPDSSEVSSSYRHFVLIYPISHHVYECSSDSVYSEGTLDRQSHLFCLPDEQFRSFLDIFLIRPGKQGIVHVKSLLLYKIDSFTASIPMLSDPKHILSNIMIQDAHVQVTEELAQIGTYTQAFLKAVNQFSDEFQ